MSSLVENGSVVLEKKIFEFLQCIFTIRNYLPLEKGGALHLNKLYPFTKGYRVPSLVEISSLVLKKILFKFAIVFLLFCYYLPLEKGGALHLN